jgi:hypothetical protein
MALFKKKIDPISDRARALSDEIASLEAQIRKLDTQLQQDWQPPAGHENPRLRSTALPHGATVHRVPEFAAPAVPTAAPAIEEPIFEEVDLNRLKARGEPEVSPDHFNELGVRKYDLPALLHRLRGQFRSPSTMNPKLVNYLAAGGIQGLRPMRYEKRVARNRFIALVVFLFVILLGIILVFVNQHH